ncbi:MAG: hypothetical protein IPG39_20775 [Bacteroidetes bacterium]|nr:hypothetical protein [Bacteroidota bacterium]
MHNWPNHSLHHLRCHHRKREPVKKNYYTFDKSTPTINTFKYFALAIISCKIDNPCCVKHIRI